MKPQADKLFTRREREVMECVVSGYTLRETAIRLCVVYQCVANHIQTIYDKAGIFDRRTLNSLTAWWFRTNFNINSSEITRRIGATCLLLLLCSYTFNSGDNDLMARRVSRRGRKNEYEFIIE